jgi:hypothetical protein
MWPKKKDSQLRDVSSKHWVAPLQPVQWAGSSAPTNSDLPSPARLDVIASRSADMAVQPMAERTTRRALWRRLVLRGAVVLTALAVLFLSSLTWLWDEFIPTNTPRPKIIEYLGKLHWYGVALLGMFVLTYLIGEAAYQAIRKAETKLETALEKHDKDYRIAKTEIARLTTMPDIKGDLLVVFWEVYRDANEMAWPKHSRYYIKLRLVNHNDVPCTIDRYFVRVEDFYEGKRAEGEGRPSVIGRLSHLTYSYREDEDIEVVERDTARDTWTRVKPINITTQSPLARGRKQEGWVTFEVWDFRPSPVKPDDIAPETFLGHWQQSISVYVVDSLGNTHTITNVLADVAPARFERS